MARIGLTPAVNDAAAAVGNAASDVAPWIVRFARVGFAAKAAFYALIGLLAARAAFGMGGETTDSRGAMRMIGDGPGGRAVLALIGVGLLGYAAWRLVSAATDAEGRGSEPKALAIRTGTAAKGVTHGWLGVVALLAAMRDASPDGGSGEQTRGWTARVLEWPFGRWLVIAVGLGVVGYGLYQLYRAMRRDKLAKRLDLHEASPTAGAWILNLGQFGVAARGVVFGLIGFLVARAAWNYAPSQAGGVEQSLDVLGGMGPLVLGTVAVGLMAYGLYELAEARYRRIRVT